MTKRFAVGGLLFFVACLLLYAGTIKLKPKLKPLFTFLNFTNSLAPANEPQDRSWVDSMPVSLNGQINETPGTNFTNYLWHSNLWSGGFRYKAGRSDWEASHYYEDLLLVDLCKAISKKNALEIERLIAAGADVNKIGKEGMTPLLWAFVVDDDPRPFGCLLKNGANPNVINYVNARSQGWVQVTSPGLAAHIW